MFSDRPFLPVAAVLLLLTAGCAGVVPTDVSSAVDPSIDGSQPSAASNQPAPAATSYASLYDRTIDSVVEITVKTDGRRSQGSGFVYSDEGYIVTNQHVVGSAETVTVRFGDRTWRTAAVVGTDVYTDLAVLKVNSLPDGVDPLPVARQPPEPGQPVVALGSPFGYEGSITHGIVSGVNRSMSTARGFSIPATIQTDAPINPGNSGGPLLSMEGRVVGVNRAKRGDNVGFAISAAVVRQVVPVLIQNGSYRHSFLGVRTVPVTPATAEANGLSQARGVMVVDVLRDGPVAGALQPAQLARTDGGTAYVGGDIIVRVEGAPIPSQQALARHLLLHTHPGETVSMTVLREGETVTVTVELGRRPELSVTDRV